MRRDRDWRLGEQERRQERQPKVRAGRGKSRRRKEGAALLCLLMNERPWSLCGDTLGLIYPKPISLQ